MAGNAVTAESASSKGTTRRECPECGVKLTRYQWSRLWWMSSFMSGRLVQPCGDCGAKLRLSSMAMVSTTAAIGLISVAIGYVMAPSRTLLVAALALLLVILITSMATRVEAAPSTGRRPA
jgi:hypothetical protein